MDFLFGSSLPLAARFFIAFLVVLALIGLTAWLVRRFGANRLGGVARGRQPRLAVIDAASVDGRRRLVLIRRDNTEHLLMIGGPSDVVVETNIVRASGATGAREPARVSMSTETTARLTSAEGSWPQSVTEPAAPIAPPRRSTATEEPWLPPEPAAPRARQIPADSLTGLAAELSSKFSAPEIAATREPSLREPSLRESMPRETMPRTTAAPNVAPALPETPPSPQSDRNLAEMAQQLEAALRRAPAQDSRPPVTDALAVPPTAKVSPRAAARDVKPRQESKIEPKFESKFDAKFESKFEPKFDSKVEPKREPKFEARLDPRLEAKPEAPTAPDKNIYDNLEEEMASLLGRPPEKS